MRIIHRGSDHPCLPDRTARSSCRSQVPQSSTPGRDPHSSRFWGPRHTVSGRGYPQAVNQLQAVWVLGMSPLPLCTRPASRPPTREMIPLGTSHKPDGGPWGIIATDRVWLKSRKLADQSGSPSARSNGLDLGGSDQHILQASCTERDHSRGPTEALRPFH